MSSCLHPVNVHGRLFPCGVCPNCTQNKRQMLSNRFLLESAFCGGPTYFVTLTYNDSCLPRYGGFPCFEKKQVQNFLKRLRKKIPRFRFFLTCEYGDLTGRPHYHALFFLQQPFPIFNMLDCIESTWNYGFASVALANDSRMAYCAKYCLKNDAYLFKDLPNNDPRKPFRLFSNRGGGIGTSAIDWINDYIYNDGNIRGHLQFSGKNITFDNFIKRHIDPSLKEEVKQLTYVAHFEEIQNRLKVAYLNNGKMVDDGIKPYFKKDYTKDNEIREHRKRLTNLKKLKL